MNQLFKKIIFSSLLLIISAIDINAQDVNNSQIDQMPSNFSTFEYDNSSSNDVENSSSNYVSNNGNPLYGPNDPQDPNAPIDNKLYILLLIVMIYGIMDYVKVKKYKLKNKLINE